MKNKRLTGPTEQNIISQALNLQETESQLTKQYFCLNLTQGTPNTSH